MDKKQSTSNISLLPTIRSKMIFVGIFSIVAVVIVGLIGISSINKNFDYSNVESYINDISMYHKDNQVLEAEYRDSVEQQCLDEIVKNMQFMTDSAEELTHHAESKYQDSVQVILESVEKSSANYSKLSELSSQRGFTTDAGLYQQYMEACAVARESFGILIDKPYWVEMNWMDGTFGETVMITNIRWANDGNSDILPYDIESVANSLNGSGLAYQSAEVTTFDGEPAIAITCNFQSSNDCWEEFAMEIPVVSYPTQNYKNILFDMYYIVDAGSGSFQYGGAYTGAYDYNAAMDSLDRCVKEYSKLVIDGKDTNESYNVIESLKTEIQENIPLYTADSALSDDSAKKFQSMITILEEMAEKDWSILAIQAENLQLSSVMTEKSNAISQMISEDMKAVKGSVFRISALVIAITTVGMVLVTLLINMGITRNATMFSETLSKIAQGQIGVRVKSGGRDEFSKFGKVLNEFLDKLEESITQLQHVSMELADSGAELEEKANVTQGAAVVVSGALSDVSKGAGEQAGDIEKSSHQVIHMCDNVSMIIKSVDTLSESSSEMKAYGKEATEIVKEGEDIRMMNKKITIRPEEHKDYKSIISLILRSFQEGTDYSDGSDIIALVEEIRDSKYYIPELSFVAELDNKVVGHFLFSHFPLSPTREGGHDNEANSEIVMLAPVSVHADYFHQGIGSAMLNMGIEKVREMGYKGITVEGNFNFYNKVGFRTSSEYNIFPTSGWPMNDPRCMMCQETYKGSLDGIHGYIVYDMYFNA